ncbi:formylglycine-generating enzyme family protein [Allocoleopsis sp.]|uniref:formylglycine-generating enzyme family protein n=1 Tax=Allocoleopsis sp. TaxID=3088169 RepID=UPI002FD3743C
MSQNQVPHSSSPEEGDAHSRQPKADDVVMGGEPSQPISGVVLGGLEGANRRLASTAIELRIAALSEALQYGDGGLDLVMAALDDESVQVQFAAYSLLKDRHEARVQQRLRNYSPWFEFEVVTVNAIGQEINRQRRQAQYFTEDLGDGVTLEMVYIPGGRFMMGSPEQEGRDSEKPQHEVTVQRFCMGKYPVTQVQWRAIASRADLKVERNIEPNPAYLKDHQDSDRLPVKRVSWYDAVEFCQRLSKLTEGKYRLPSEAEWEYACRAGTTTPFHFGETITDQLANYDARRTFADEPPGKYRGDIIQVGSFPPNAFGLYDMHGNVWEWCCDPWHKNYSGAPTDGSVWEENNHQYQIFRGGSWIIFPSLCRCASRGSDIPTYIDSNLGFRVVSELPRIVQ